MGCTLASAGGTQVGWGQAAHGNRDPRTDKGAAAGRCVVNGKRIWVAKGVGSDGVRVGVSGCVLGICDLRVSGQTHTGSRKGEGPSCVGFRNRRQERAGRPAVVSLTLVCQQVSQWGSLSTQYSLKSSFKTSKFLWTPTRKPSGMGEPSWPCFFSLYSSKSFSR